MAHDLAQPRQRAARALPRVARLRRRRGDVGQPRHHASRPPVALERAARDGAHHHLRHASRRARAPGGVSYGAATLAVIEAITPAAVLKASPRFSMWWRRAIQAKSL